MRRGWPGSVATTLVPVLAVVSLSGAIAAGAGPEDSWRRGVVLFVVSQDSRPEVEPGRRVAYRIVEREIGGRREHQTDVRLRRGVMLQGFNGRVIPDDPEFTLARILIHLRSLEHVGSHQDHEGRVHLERFLLARNASRLYPAHALHEELSALACRFSRLQEGFVNEKTDYPITLRMLGEHLAAFPEGAHRDELEWLELRLENAVYEYESRAEHPLAEIRAYRAYLDRRPETGERARIELRLARLHRIVYECLVRDVSGEQAGREKEGLRHREMALELYGKLAEHVDVDVAAEASVALFNLRQGRGCYQYLPRQGDW